MRWLWVFLATVVGALAGARLLQDPGYVLVRAGTWVFESSIAAGLLAVLGAAVVFLLLAKGIRRLAASIGFFGRWRSARQQHKSVDLWQRASKAIALGDWNLGATLLAKTHVAQEHQLEVLLVRAANLWRNRDESGLQSLFEQAAEMTAVVDLRLAVARWQLSDGAAGLAMQNLAKLAPPERAPLEQALTERAASAAWAGLYAWGLVEQRRWQDLHGHWTAVEKNQVLKSEAFRDQMSLLRAGKAMADSVVGDTQKDPASWRTGLKNLPKQWQTDPKTLSQWAQWLIESGRQEQARQMLEQALAKSWQPVLVRCYGDLDHPDSVVQASEQVGQWLKKTPEDPELLLAMGRLLRANNQTELSREPLLKAARVLSSASSEDLVALRALVLAELGSLVAQTA